MPDHGNEAAPRPCCQPSSPHYWTALGISLVAGFLAPLPCNYWRFERHGKACH